MILASAYAVANWRSAGGRLPRFIRISLSF